MRIAFVVANEGIEQVELTEPWNAVKEAGGTPELLAPKPGKAQAMNHMELADTFDVDKKTADAQLEDYSGVVLPGGVANPDQLRTDEAAVAFLKSAFEAGIPVAAICHGPWTLVEADVVRGRTMTSWPSLKTDITNAGGVWVDEEVKVCTIGPNALITSRKPDDLEAFCRTLVEEFTRVVASASA
jgi:protease I